MDIFKAKEVEDYVEATEGEWGFAGSSVTALRPWARHINPCLVLGKPRKTHPEITENSWLEG